jgi:hypothetical protein
MRGGLSLPWRIAIVLGAIAVSAVWVLVSHPFEGPVLFSFSEDHGVHATDPLIVIPLALAFVMVTRR